MTRKSDRQNQQPPSIEPAKKRSAKTGPNGPKPESEGPSEYHFDIDEYSQQFFGEFQPESNRRKQRLLNGE